MSQARKWTSEQNAAISTVGKSILVSAAAGSGKTAVLAERCAHLVCDGKPPCGIDQLLVVTFTESAAAEMKTRIQQALRARIAKDQSDRLARQLALAEHANVSTVHGFCARVLRQNFNLIGLDPSFQIFDGDEAELLRAEVARELFDRAYENDDTGEFQRLIDCYGDGNDERLIEQVVSTHELLSSLVDPAGWIDRVNRELSDAASQPFETSKLGKALIDQVACTLTQISNRCGQAIGSIRVIGGFPKYIDQLHEFAATIEHWQTLLKGGGFDDLAGEVQDYRAAKPPAPRTANNVEGKQLAKSLLDGVKDAMVTGPLVEMLSFTAAQWKAGLVAIGPYTKTFLALVSSFSSAYTDAKNAERALDFADLERLTLNVLREPSIVDKLHPSDVARGYHAQFHHVLVDEYQDINEIQDAILTLVSRECVTREGKHTGNLFCVGDVKQSIFRFRLAEPARFLNRQDHFRGNAGKSLGQVIDLRENFRSREPLLDAINAVFERLMTREAADIQYDESHLLRAGKTFPQWQSTHFRGAPIELHLLPASLTEDADAESTAQTEEAEAKADLERADYEAILVANRIRKMIGKEGSPAMMVMKPDASGNLAPTPIGYGDIVILLRSMQYKADTFADVLRGHDIPVHSEGGSGFFGATEVRDILALLKVLDNQQQDIPLAAVLRSPLAAIAHGDDALARIRLAYPNGTEAIAFHEAVRRYAAEKEDELAARLRDFFVLLDDWRDQARKRPVAELLWKIYDQTGYLAFCAGLEDGNQRVANLVDLHERARQFGSFSRQGLYRFLNFLNRLREQKELSRPSVASEAESAVRIMSIHRAKGLEFPVVVLPDLGKRHNLSDARGAILVDRVAGLGMAVVDQARRIRYPSLTSTLVKTSLLRQTRAEEMRLLYVAMTRAKEHLIMVGTCGNDALDKWRSQFQNQPGPLATDTILNGQTPLDWLGPVAAMTLQMPKPVFIIKNHEAGDVKSWQNPRDLRRKFTPLQEQLAMLLPLDPPPAADDIARRLMSRFGYVYPHEHYTHAAASAAVTAMAAHGVPESSDHPAREPLRRQLDLPKFAAEQATPNAADIGTITHLVMQHWHFDGNSTDAAIGSRISEMISRKMISAEQARHVNRNAIAWFLKTDLGQMLHDCGQTLYRELPFALPHVPEDSPAPPSSDPMDRLMVRGRIDLLVPRGDGLAIVDYKTDNVTGEALEARAEVYRQQMGFYRQAIEGITGKKVTAIFLVFLSASRIIENQVG